MVLGCDDVYRLVRVEVSVPTTGKLLGKTCADNLHTIKAEDGVYYGIVVVGDKLLRYRLCLGKTRLLCGDVDVVADMAVAGGKVPLYNTKKQVFLLCSDLVSFTGWHKVTSFLAFSFILHESFLYVNIFLIRLFGHTAKMHIFVYFLLIKCKKGRSQMRATSIYFIEGRTFRKG